MTDGPSRTGVNEEGTTKSERLNTAGHLHHWFIRRRFALRRDRV